jgi:hypothetical protein
MFDLFKRTVLREGERTRRTKTNSCCESTLESYRLVAGASAELWGGLAPNTQKTSSQSIPIYNDDISLTFSGQQIFSDSSRIVLCYSIKLLSNRLRRSRAPEKVNICEA